MEESGCASRTTEEGGSDPSGLAATTLDMGPFTQPESEPIAWWGYVLRAFGVIVCLYVFICSLDILSNSFRLIGGRAAGSIFNENQALNNPIAGLMIGVLVTVLVQSSSTSSSIVVAMVSSSILKVKPAVPIIMGANIGTSVTNTIVALSQIQDNTMFKRAFAAATVHDMFNLLTVTILLPLNWVTDFLVIASEKMVDSLHLPKSSEAKIEILSRLTDPLIDQLILVDKGVITRISMGEEVGKDERLLEKTCEGNTTCDALFNRAAFALGLDDKIAGFILLAISLFFLFVCLVSLVKILQSVFRGHISVVIHKTVNADFPGPFRHLTGYVAILIGVIMTIMVQSSSIFTSTLTPLVGLNIIDLERAFPLTLGSNIGTTVTSILAALASEGENFKYALQISFCHLLFNVIGILIWYPLEPMRRIPLSAARKLGATTATYRWFSLAYILFVFLVLPGFVFAVSMAGEMYIIFVAALIFSLAVMGFTLKLLQKNCSSYLPNKLKTFRFLPLPLRSLEPYDSGCRSLFKLVKRLFGFGSSSTTAPATGINGIVAEERSRSGSFSQGHLETRPEECKRVYLPVDSSGKKCSPNGSLCKSSVSLAQEIDETFSPDNDNDSKGAVNADIMKVTHV